MAMLTNSALIAALFAVGCTATSSEVLANHSFAGYMATFGKGYAKGSSEHSMREGIFSERMREILAHNAAGHAWTMGLNEFTDWTEDELRNLRGYKKQHTGDSMPSSVMQLGNVGDVEPAEGPAGLTEALDWSSSLTEAQRATSKEVLSQGACGSCWAVAAAAAIQLHASKEFPRFNKVLSPENINKCAPNPMECGGQGGCQGSTPALAFEYVKSLGSRAGLYPMDQLPYTASTGAKIPEDSCSAGPSFLQVKNFRAQPAVSIAGFTVVEANNAAKVMEALTTKGPLAVAIVGAGIQGYSGGVINKCRNMEIDHAVVMMGFGLDAASGLKYWNIRNSWGKDWGEQGYFRLQRHHASGAASSEEPCAWDNDPAKGVACKDAKGEYPKRSWVCGECGIVSDVAFPTGVNVHDALLI